MKNKKSRITSKKAFTLIELLIVIAIIGILASVVTVSTQSAVTKSKRASALTSASSVLPELVMCADDGGRVSAYSANGVICIQAASTSALAGHTATWPNTVTKTGWTIVNATASAAPVPSNFSFTVTHPTDATSPIRCNLSNNSCE